MRIDSDVGEIEVLNEVTYTFGSVDNVRTYPFAKILSATPCAVHGVLLNGEPLAVFGDGGFTTVGQHSAIYLEGYVFLAVGDKVVCFRPKPFELKWQLQVDTATCFGIHYQAERRALISHGELEIARFSEDGRLLWSASGADIFSEGVALLSHCIEAVDFNNRVYHFDYATGAALKATDTGVRPDAGK
jgi:outer membrane protein assembly factor BamB